MDIPTDVIPLAVVPRELLERAAWLVKLLDDMDTRKTHRSPGAILYDLECLKSQSAAQHIGADLEAALAAAGGAGKGGIMADELRATAAESKGGCPCLYTTPCHSRCPCLGHSSSKACRRCCRYGNLDQRTARAAYLAGKINAPDHPTEDGAAVTPGLVERLGMRESPADFGVYGAAAANGTTVEVHFEDEGGACWTYGDEPLPDQPTAGHVTRLLAALGVELPAAATDGPAAE